MQVEAVTVQVPLNRAEFQKSRNMNAILAGLSLFMVPLSFAALLYCLYSSSGGYQSLEMRIISACCCLCFAVLMGSIAAIGLHTTYLQTQILSQGLPAIVVDGKGVTDNVSNYVFGFISWLEVEDVVLSSRYSSKLNKTFLGIAIVVGDANVLLRKKPKTVAIWVWPDDEIMKKCQVFIPQERIAVPIEDVVEQINTFRARVKV